MGRAAARRLSGAGTRSKSRFSTTRKRRRSGSSSENRRNHGCWRASGVRMFSRMPVLLPLLGPAQDGLGRARPAAEHAEGVADPQEGRGLVGAYGVEEAEGRPFPGRVFADSLAPLADPVVPVGIDVAGPARAQVEREPPPGRLGHLAPAPHVERQGPDPQARAHEGAEKVARRVLDGVDQRVVPEVGPAVVHVEDGHVDGLLVGGREVLGPLDPCVAEHAEGGARGTARRARLPPETDLVLAVEGHRLPCGPQPSRPRGTHGRQVYRCGRRRSSRHRRPRPRGQWPARGPRSPRASRRSTSPPEGPPGAGPRCRPAPGR